MPRHASSQPLDVYINHRLVGHLEKRSDGAIEFSYDTSWLDWENTFPISLSLPLREDRFRGERVIAVFENLLPDVDALRRQVAEHVGAGGTDAFSLLSVIGRDCVGALQFLSADTACAPDTTGVRGKPVSEGEIADLLGNLARAPLGLDQNDAFRISIAGAQEKTALLFHEGQWLKPIGTTPTTHIFKTPLGELPNGIDLTDSVENEFYCLKLLQAFGIPTNKATIGVFGAQKALIVERFDRLWTRDGRLLRLPQEDLCQALSVPPTLKYQNEGGPGIVRTLTLLKGSDDPAADQQRFLEAQILFWLIGATDGHAKNFSIFISPGGRYRLTPFYDVLTAEPALRSETITRRQMKMAMSVGTNKNYRMDKIHGRHFRQAARMAGISELIAVRALDRIREAAGPALQHVQDDLPRDFPFQIHEQVSERIASLLRGTITND